MRVVCQVHYKIWGSRYDELLRYDSARLALRGTHVVHCPIGGLVEIKVLDDHWILGQVLKR